MDDLISRQAAIDAIKRVIWEKQIAKDAIDAVCNVPSAQPERKKGKWIEYDNSHCECPVCHEEWSYFDDEPDRFNFCPNCGAELE